ncbi:ribonuclease HII [Paenibacillus mucilaginosus]|uniref:ribonuclease HII n=1 Tax=Paenibacillus mucilaginosus TaxID=61624 RepID=UPI003D1FDDA1
MLEYEQSVWSAGKRLVAGVDEVGRGCLFGDVVAAAVILPQGLVLEEVNDSKKLSAKKRDKLYDIIRQEAVAVGVGIVDVETIEKINIRQASLLAMKLAVKSLEVTPDYLLVDAEQVNVPIEQMSLIHGDAVSQAIAAASIIAKVTRDRMCLKWDEEFPGYGLADHKGYATKFHRERILEFGPTAMHRSLFLRKLLGTGEEEEVEQGVLF